MNLRIAPGETIACAGPTGAGKSTPAELVARIHDPGQGAVLIDGHDVREVTLELLHRQVGVVPQEPFRFAGTLPNACWRAVPPSWSPNVFRMAAGCDGPVQ